VTFPTGPLVELAQAYGVMTEYVDWRGRQVQVSAETIEAVLEAMGVDAVVGMAIYTGTIGNQ